MTTMKEALETRLKILEPAQDALTEYAAGYNAALTLGQYLIQGLIENLAQGCYTLDEKKDDHANP